MRKAIIVIFCFISLVKLTGCSSRPEPEKLPISVRQNFNLLQKDPQFVMYLNFKMMRGTDFWKTNVSDSIFSAERTFGSLLYSFKESTGASVNENLDELYYSNSWIGENSIVLKGVFDKSKLDEILKTDSSYTITTYSDGTKIYHNEENKLYFFFRDNNTICASNYYSRIDEMIPTKDTSATGLVTNDSLMRVINEIIYKNNIMMVSSEPTFIRGIFMNFLGSPPDAEMNSDSAMSGIMDDINTLYKSINSISFSAKMDKNLKFLIQGECFDNKEANRLKNYMKAILTITKFKPGVASGKTEENEVSDLVKNISVKQYDNSVYIEISITSENINLFRKSLN
ncbi:MAG TPA: hypothetical protein PLG90_01565 [Ignavibacteria bacterium]|nr:hypothetical protein [Ignavibacteria bacterium]